MKRSFLPLCVFWALVLSFAPLASGRASHACVVCGVCSPSKPLFKGIFPRHCRALPAPREPRRFRRAPKQETVQVCRDVGSVSVNHFLLSRAGSSATRVVVDISKQRAYLLVGGEIAVETPISTALSGKRTPRGSFTITERVRSNKYSTIYGVAMPYWMRLNNTVFGLHAGHLPGHPASAGCIRLHPGAAPLIFNHTRRGTRVDIYSSWR